MKIKGLGKYFLAILACFAVIYNLVLFIVVSKVDKEILNTGSFWIAYVWMMLALIAWGVMGILEKSNNLGGLRPMMTSVYLYELVTFVLSTFIIIVAKNLGTVWAILIAVAVTVLAVMLGVFGKLQTAVINQNPARVIKVYTIEELEIFFNTVASQCSGDSQAGALRAAQLVAGLSTIPGNDELEQLDKRIIERCHFIKDNALRGETNLSYNIQKLQQLLKDRQDIVDEATKNANN